MPEAETGPPTVVLVPEDVPLRVGHVDDVPASVDDESIGLQRFVEDHVQTGEPEK